MLLRFALQAWFSLIMLAIWSTARGELVLTNYSSANSLRRRRYFNALPN